MTHPSFNEILALIPPGHSHLLTMFGSLPPGAQAQIVGCAGVKSLKGGQVVVEEDIESTELGYVLSGTLGMVKSLPDGRVHIIGLLMTNDMYGRLFNGPVGYRIEALTDVTLLCFERGPFEVVLSETPEIERMFLVSILDELDAAREWVLLLNGKKVIERVASFLLFLMRRDIAVRSSTKPGPAEVHLPVRRCDLSHCLGIRPESLSRALHRLAHDKIIRKGSNDAFLIIDLPELARTAGQDLFLPDRTTGRAGPYT